MTEQLPPFFLIVADHDQGFFCVEGPMTDRPWRDAAMNARNNQRRIYQCVKPETSHVFCKRRWGAVKMITGCSC